MTTMSELDARIACTVDTRDELRARKSDAERYEDVLQRLLSSTADGADTND